ncbi:MAG: hypothetical protein FRX48_05354 [Lasallia pustulata]|uniref:Major facilitator superfamily domain, general substrate transporter n=1 Tax=Lasallia pustulata TaxID=136370 RepID=A0A5M8PNK5_9LECA|nr:MAG: hypothetical protein FRX48_05354 [Lasallia pustulata]
MIIPDVPEINDGLVPRETKAFNLLEWQSPAFPTQTAMVAKPWRINLDRAPSLQHGMRGLCHAVKESSGEDDLLSLVAVYHFGPLYMSLHAPRSRRPSEEHSLLSQSASGEWTELSAMGSGDDQASRVEERYVDERGDRVVEEREGAQGEEEGGREEGEVVVYKVYKRRWFGLIQLVLLNIIVSWDVRLPHPRPLTLLPLPPIPLPRPTNPPSQWLLLLHHQHHRPPFPHHPHHHKLAQHPLPLRLRPRLPLRPLHPPLPPPRTALQIASLLLLLGNWLRYLASRLPSLPTLLIGQVLIGLAQPFVLTTPTAYSSLWFPPHHRVTTTALASLANPLGGALAQLTSPFLTPSPSSIPSTTLYITLLSTLSTIPSLFLPAYPPPRLPPPSSPDPLLPSLHRLLRTPTFYLLLLPFTTYVSLFNALSSVLTQILTPYAYTEPQSGLAGGILILAGLASAALTSPLVDRAHAHLLLIRLLVPCIAAAYLAFVFAPETRGVVAPYVILAVLGAASFSLVPVALEFLVEVTEPVGPEVGSCVCWAGGSWGGRCWFWCVGR